MEAIYVIAIIAIYAGGVITGIYVHSQVKGCINKRISNTCSNCNYEDDGHEMY